MKHCDDPFSKVYKHRHGEPVSDACGDGKHSECTQDLTKCHCTYRSGHTVMHAYMNPTPFPVSQSQTGPFQGTVPPVEAPVSDSAPTYSDLLHEVEVLRQIVKVNGYSEAPVIEPWCETCDTNDCECVKANLPVPKSPVSDRCKKCGLSIPKEYCDCGNAIQSPVSDERPEFEAWMRDDLINRLGAAPHIVASRLERETRYANRTFRDDWAEALWQGWLARSGQEK